MPLISSHLTPTALPGDPQQTTALLVNPPVYDIQYRAEWSQPYRLLRIASLLKKLGCKRHELFDFMEAPGEKRKMTQRRIAPGRLFDTLSPILNNVDYFLSDIGVFKMLKRNGFEEFVRQRLINAELSRGLADAQCSKTPSTRVIR